MPNWKQITLVVFVLIGGTMAFSYWSFNQFNNTLNDLDATLTANILLTPSSLEKKTELASIPTSSSLELSFSLETSEALTIPTSSSLELSFNFPQKGAEVYIGCIYPISWQSSVTIHSLETVLVNAGTKESMGPIASGLAKEHAIDKDLQNLKWKVGVVLPGAYYIQASRINGVSAEFRSKVFEINNMPEGLDEKEINRMCYN